MLNHQSNAMLYQNDDIKTDAREYHFVGLSIKHISSSKVVIYFVFIVRWNIYKLKEKCIRSDNVLFYKIELLFRSTGHNNFFFVQRVLLYRNLII